MNVVTPPRLLLLPALMLLSACASSSKNGSSHPPPAVQHVVVCWLKEPGDERARQKIIDRSHELKQIPGVLGVSTGRAVPSDRPTVDSSFDVAVVMTFRDREALREYDRHPIHRKAVEEVLKPLTARVIIYDMEVRR